MPKLGVFSGEEIARILGAEGFVRVRQRGSHLIMQKQAGASTITVPVPTASHGQDWHVAVHHPAIRRPAQTLPGLKLMLRKKEKQTDHGLDGCHGWARILKPGGANF